MFLAVTEAERKRPLLYCYWSERWQAYLLPFLMHQNDINGNFNAKDYVSTYVKHQYRSTARATGKFVVSVKQNQEHPTEYWLYAFEFYSLVLPEEFSSKGPCRWLDLDRLSDPKYPEAKINGDVIRAIRAYWGTWLDNLERSAVSVQWSLFGD
jgi:hypothetical protein